MAEHTQDTLVGGISDHSVDHPKGETFGRLIDFSSRVANLLVDEARYLYYVNKFRQISVLYINNFDHSGDPNNLV